MKIAVFGATGTIGRRVVEQAVQRGHEVTAYSRHATTLDDQERLHRVVGDVCDAANVQSTVSGQDAVVVTLGAGRKGSVRKSGTATVVAAMRQAGVRRLICQSTIGVGDSRGNLNFLWKYLMFGVLLRPAYRDHVAQEAVVTASDLDWTIVRPAAFTDGAHTGTFRHGFGGDVTDTTLKISRADVAGFVVDQLTDDTYLRRTPALAY